MAKRDFDFKQFMLQKGDKVGMGIAGGLAVLLLFLGVFMLFGKEGSLSPTANANNLNTASSSREQQLNTGQPSEADRQAWRTVDPELKKKDLNEKILGEQYAMLFPPMTKAGAEDPGRRNPTIFQPVEFLVGNANAQLSFYIFQKKDDDERGLVAVLTNPQKTDKNNKGGGAGPGNFSMLKGGAGGMGSAGPGGPRGGPGGRGPIGPGGPGGPGGGYGMGGYGAGGGPGGAKSDDKGIRFIRTEDYKQGDPLAESVFPIRAAMIVGAFPLKKQLEEYKKALHTQSISELYDSARPEFGFLGLKVQKRVVAGLGDNKGEPWVDVDLEGDFKWWMMNNGQRPEPEEPELANLLHWSDGLVMDRPLQITDKSQPYPPLETELPSIKKSLEQLKNLGKKATPPKNQFNDPTGLSPFKHRGAGAGGQEMGEAMPGKPGGGGAAPFKPGTGAGGGGSDGAERAGATVSSVEPPEFALIRFLDFELEPGKTYEYQVKVLLNNPNFGRTDVPSYLSDKKELESEWTAVGHRFSFSEEIQYYAFDTKKVGAMLPQHNQAVLQIHRWVPSVDVTPKGSRTTNLPVGEWLIAERALVYKGEEIGQPHRLKVPVWMHSQAAFQLATCPTARTAEKHIIDVPFRGIAGDAVLVDFTGPEVTYKKAPKAKDNASDPVAVEVKQEASAELLILTTEGKLILRDRKTDSSPATPEGEEREKRVKLWKERMKKIEDAEKGTKPGDDLFNKGGGGGTGGGGQ
jgi:hypothetical protein